MNPFNPAFLKRFDKFLLQNHPLVWVTRIHYVLLYGVYLFTLSFLLGLVFPMDVIHPNSLGVYYLLFILISITLYVIWIYKNAIFNIESRFGKRSVWDEYKLFFIYFFTITLLCTNYLPFQMVNEYKMSHAIADEEYVRELNILNLADPFLITSTYDYQQTYDSTREHTYYDYGDYTSWNKFTPSYYSGYRMFGSSYYDGQWNGGDKFFLNGSWDDSTLIKKFESLNTDAKKKQAIADYLAVFSKYNRSIDLSADEVLRNYNYYVSLGKTLRMPAYSDYSSSDYRSVNKEDMASVYRNVGEAKLGRVYYMNWEYYLAIFYVIFYCTLFFMMFRNVRWQQFLVTLIAMAIIPLVLGILFQIMRSAIGRYDSEEWFGGTLILIYLGLFTYSIIFKFAPPKRYSPFASILLQISNLCTPVALLFMLLFAHEVFNAFQYRIPYELSSFDLYFGSMTDSNVNMIKNYPAEVKSVLFHHEVQNWWRACYERWIAWTQIIGIVFYVALYMPYMKEQFVKLRALPKKK